MRMIIGRSLTPLNRRGRLRPAAVRETTTRAESAECPWAQLGRIRRRQRLGGLLNYYYRAA
jgi:hypothetical protein